MYREDQPDVPCREYERLAQNKRRSDERRSLEYNDDRQSTIRLKRWTSGYGCLGYAVNLVYFDPNHPKKFPPK